MRKKHLLTSLMAGLTLCVLFLACSKDKDPQKTVTFDDFEYGGSFAGMVDNDGDVSDVDGYITIDQNGKAVVSLLNGTMEGTAQKSGENYSLNLVKGTGSYKEVANITGVVETTTGATSITGTNVGGTPIAVTGQVTVISGDMEIPDTLNNAVIYFSHLEPMLASITIDGETIDGLDIFYQNELYCGAPLWGSVYNKRVDTMQSRLNCVKITIKGLDGEPKTFNQCTSIQFVLPKNKKYNYTVEWQNGTTTTGSFTAPKGGQTLFVCLSASGGSGGGGGSTCGLSNNTLKFGNTNRTVDAVECDMDDVYTLYAEATNGDEIEVMLPSQPTANGTYTVINAQSATSLNPGQAALYAYTDATDLEYASVSGTVKVTMVGGKPQVEFCNVSMKEIDGAATISVGGKFTCQ